MKKQQTLTNKSSVNQNKCRLMRMNHKSYLHTQLFCWGTLAEAARVPQQVFQLGSRNAVEGFVKTGECPSSMYGQLMVPDPVPICLRLISLKVCKQKIMHWHASC